MKTPELIVDFNGSKTFSVVRLRENIRLGQRIEAFALDAWTNGDWKEIATATSIGPSRLIRLATPHDDEPPAAAHHESAGRAGALRAGRLSRSADRAA